MKSHVNSSSDCLLYVCVCVFLGLGSGAGGGSCCLGIWRTALLFSASFRLFNFRHTSLRLNERFKPFHLAISRTCNSAAFCSQMHRIVPGPRGLAGLQWPVRARHVKVQICMSGGVGGGLCIWHAHEDVSPITSNTNHISWCIWMRQTTGTCIETVRGNKGTQTARWKYVKTLHLLLQLQMSHSAPADS